MPPNGGMCGVPAGHTVSMLSLPAARMSGGTGGARLSPGQGVQAEAGLHKWCAVLEWHFTKI